MAPSRNRIAYYRDRCIPPLTQRALARLLGVHWNTVVNWERDGVPSAADLLRILEVFVTRRAIRDQAAATQFWAVSARMPIEPPPEVAMLFAPTGSPSERATSTAMTTQAQSAEPSLLPYHRNPLFIGRAAELAALTHNLARCTASAITCIAGVGKTQLACEFAYHARDRFPGGVFWISFANPEAIAAAVARCGWAGHLHIHPRFHHLSLPEQVDLVRAAWRAPVARLLIFDNCEQEALFADWRPAVGGSHILITSRRMHWNPTLGVCPIKLGTLQRDESVRLLGQYTRGQTIAASMLEELAAWVGDLPLALHIIGSRLNQVQNTAQLDSYLTQMRLRTVGLVESPVALYSPTAHTSSLSDTFDASLQLLEEAQLGNRLARIVIDCAACFAAGEIIDRQLLSDAVCAVMAELDVTQLAAALVQAINVALLLDEGDQALKMHRLIVEHVWQRATNVEVIVHAVAQTLLQHARRAFEASDFATLLALYPHLRSVADRATAAADTLGAELHEVVGEWLVHSGAYTAAQASLLRAYAIWQARGTHLSIDIARCSNLLGLAFQLNGDYAQAARSYEQAYTIWKAALGENHLDTATAASNLGYLLFVRGDQARARDYLEAALQVRQAHLAPTHPDVARSLNNLGYVRYRQGDYLGAMPLLHQAFALREATYGDAHPATAQSLNNMGDLFTALGDDDQAASYFTRALAAREFLFGDDHIDTAESLRKLGDIHRRTGDTASAWQYYRRALHICEQSAGTTSLDTAWTLAAIALLQEETGEYHAAYTCYQRVLQIFQQVLAPEHDDLIATRERLLALAVILGLAIAPRANDPPAV